MRRMKTFCTLLVTLALAACETPSSTTNTSGLRPAGPSKPVTFGGGDGSSYEKAIVVHASGESTGVHSEYDYIKAHYPGYHFISQALVNHKEKAYDVMTFTDAHGKKHVLYFEISEYLGRF